MDPFEVSPFESRSGGTGLVPAAEALAAELMGLAPIVESHVNRADQARHSGIAELASGADESERHMRELHAYDTAQEADAAGGTLEGGDLAQLVNGRWPVHPGEAEQPPPGYYLTDRVTGPASHMRPDVERQRGRAPLAEDEGRGGRDRGAGRREPEEEAPPPPPEEAPPPPPPTPERNGGRR